MKRLISAIVLMLTICMLTACSTQEKTPVSETTSPTKAASDDDSAKLSIVCCNFPEYDWVRNIVEGSENVVVKLLVDDGTDIHSFQPSAEDMVTVSDCDMFVYAGGESTSWMEDILENATNENMTVINLVEAPYVYVLCEDGHTHEEGETHTEEELYDEHLWLSLHNAGYACEYIAECLGYMDMVNEDLYTANCESYKAKLNELSEAYEIAVDTAKEKTVVFADRFPFQYMMNDYEIEYYAAFPGCSTETDASFQTIIELAKKIDELGLKNVVIVEGSDGAVAKSVVENTEGEAEGIIEMNSMQTVTTEDIEEGATYLNYMEENLKTLVKALEVSKE